jgi:hypothetical protein
MRTGGSSETCIRPRKAPAAVPIAMAAIEMPILKRKPCKSTGSHFHSVTRALGRPVATCASASPAASTRPTASISP